MPEHKLCKVEDLQEGAYVDLYQLPEPYVSKEDHDDFYAYEYAAVDTVDRHIERAEDGREVDIVLVHFSTTSIAFSPGFLVPVVVD
jgi:hypothetical protein